MHKGFLDRNRRYLNLRENRVDTILPEHFTQSYPKFVALLEKYYEWQDQNDPNELINHLFASRDINETDISLLSFIEDEFLLGEAYFEGFGTNDWEKRAAANFSNHLFRSKGTKFAIEWFFRSFYGLDAEAIYTKENVFTLNQASSQIGPDSLKYLTNDKLYQTFALLIRVGVPISKWKDIFKLFAHPAGMYLGAEVSINDIVTETLQTAMDDSAVNARDTSFFNISYSPNPSVENRTIEFTVQGTNIPDNTTGLYYYVNHLTTTDDDFIQSTPTLDSMGYISIEDVNGSAIGKFSLIPKIDSDESEGAEQFQVFARDTSGRERTNINVLLNDAISEYTISPKNILAAEGSNIDFAVTGTKVPTNGSTNLYYYVRHITTNDSDFLTPPPDSASPEPFLIRNSIGNFSLKTKIDNDVSDDGEQFKVVIKTFEGVEKDEATVTLLNIAPFFSTSTIGNVTEGTNITTQINVAEQDIGNTISWEITGNASSDSRISSNTGSFVVASANQTLSIPVGFDPAYNGPISGTLTLTNNNYNPPISSSQGFILRDAQPTFSLDMNPTVASEGDTVAFDVSGTNIQDGTYYFYIDNITTDDLDFLGGRPTNTNRESVSVTSNSGTTSNITFSDSAETQNETFAGLLYLNSSNGTFLTSKQFTIAGSTYTLTPSTTSVNENANVNFTLSGNDGVYYYWIVPVFGDVNENDFLSGWATNNNRIPFTVSGGSGSFGLTIANDLVTEGAESFYIRVSNSPSGGIIAESATVTINDTSTTPVISLDSVTGPSDVDEGSPATINVTTSNVPDGSVLNWSVSRTEDFDTDTGTVTITGNSGEFTVTPSPDATTEAAAETFTVTVSGTVDGTSLSRTSASITINDTSQTVTTIPSGTFIAQKDNEGSGLAAYIRDQESSDDGETVFASAKMTTRFSRENDGFAIKIELDQANNSRLWYQPVDIPNTLTTSPITIYTNTNVVPDEIRMVYNATIEPIGLVGADIDLGWQSTPSNGIEQSLTLSANASAGAGGEDFNGRVYTVKYYGRADGYDDTLLATFKYRVQAYAEGASF